MDDYRPRTLWVCPDCQGKGHLELHEYLMLVELDRYVEHITCSEVAILCKRCQGSGAIAEDPT